MLGTRFQDMGRRGVRRCGKASSLTLFSTRECQYRSAMAAHILGVYLFVFGVGFLKAVWFRCLAEV